jgi:hypothetical protein
MARSQRPVALLLASAALVASSVWLSAQATERAVFVSVLDRNGARVPDLGVADFTVTEDNVKREVLRVEPASDPMQVALLIDNSEQAEPFIRELRGAMPALVRGLAEDPNVQGRHLISVITLAARPTIASDYNPDPAVAIKELQRVFAQSFSGTYLMDGIIEVSQGMTRRQYSRPVMVAVVTDGADLSNRYRDQVLDPLARAGAALHVTVLGPQQSTSTERSIVIQQGTSRSGGSYDVVLAPSGLTSRMTRLASELTSQYKVTYSRPDTFLPPERVSVTSSRQGVTVRATPEVVPTARRR